jgi:xanthosine utilization system XapX-like protein
MLKPDIPRIFHIGGAGILVAVWWALIHLEPTKAPDYLVKGFVVVGMCFVFVGGAIVISDWITYFRERLADRER